MSLARKNRQFGNTAQESTPYQKVNDLKEEQQLNIRYCPTCNGEIKEEIAQYCYHCGAELKK